MVDHLIQKWIDPWPLLFFVWGGVYTANPQAEDGHVDIANEIVDALAHIRLSGEEMQCLWVIIRKTYGWHKKDDKISLSQFSNMTGIKRQNVSRALNKLSSKKIIAVIKNDDTNINIYRFLKDFDNWQPLSKKITLSSKKITPVINIDNQVSSKMMHTKENVYKRKDTKERVVSSNSKLSSKKMTDEEFLDSLKSKYTWLNFDQEMSKIDAWLLANPGRQKTRRFIVNWLNKIERPLGIITPIVADRPNPKPIPNDFERDPEGQKKIQNIVLSLSKKMDINQ